MTEMRTKEQDLQRELDFARQELQDKEHHIADFVKELPEMEIKTGCRDEWERIVEVNKDDEYSKAVVDTAESLAKVLQTFGKVPEDRKGAVRNAISMVDSTGLTGFQVECIRSLLRKVWKYGEEFFPRGESL